MDNLRLILVVVGICIIVGIYLWDRIQTRRQARHHRVNTVHDMTDESGLVIPARQPGDDDFSEELADLNSFMSASDLDDDDTEAEAIVVTRDAAIETSMSQGRGGMTEISDLFGPGATSESAEATHTHQEPGNNISTESVIALFIATPASGEYLSGRDIYTALTSLGFRYGDMDIFHHYGSGHLTTGQPLFSLANMYEPGSFDIDTIENMSTRGLSVFLCLPTPTNAGETFEFMLEICRRLAGKLNADVLGPDRKPLSQRSLDNIAVQLRKYDE